MLSTHRLPYHSIRELKVRLSIKINTNYFVQQHSWQMIRLRALTSSIEIECVCTHNDLSPYIVLDPGRNIDTQGVSKSCRMFVFVESCQRTVETLKRILLFSISAVFALPINVELKHMYTYILHTHMHVHT